MAITFKLPLAVNGTREDRRCYPLSCALSFAPKRAFYWLISPVCERQRERLRLEAFATSTASSIGGSHICERLPHTPVGSAELSATYLGAAVVGLDAEGGGRLPHAVLAPDARHLVHEQRARLLRRPLPLALSPQTPPVGEREILTLL